MGGTGEKAGMLTPYLDAVKSAFESIWPAVKDLWDVIQNKLWPAIEPLVMFIATKLLPAAVKIQAFFLRALIPVITKAAEAFAFMLTWINHAVEGLAILGKGIGGGFIAAWNGVWKAVNKVITIFQRVVHWIGQAIGKVKEFFKNPIGSIGSAIGGLFGRSASGRTAAMGRAATGRAVTSSTVTVHGAMMPQETARYIAQVMNGARVRTGLVGIRP